MENSRLQFAKPALAPDDDPGFTTIRVHSKGLRFCNIFAAVHESTARAQASE
jgi:hypothetical protein